jgi:hypothetical protein
MKNILLGLASFGFSLFLVGCSVKEGRTDCPCHLGLDYSLVHNDSVVPLSVIGNGSVLFRDSSDRAEIGNRLTAPVPKGYNVVYYCQGVENCTKVSDAVMIPFGREFDRFFAGSDKVDCTNEFAFDTLRLHKQYCKLSLIFRTAKNESYRNSIAVLSDVGGIRLTDLQPISGDFKFSPVVDSDNRASVVLPRQMGGKIDLVITDYLTGKDETVDLKALFESVGYSWVKRDLDDLEIVLDFSKSKFTVLMTDWQSGVTNKIEI